MGASQRFLVLKVAIPAAMPHVFVGLFMGLGASFAVLVVAEMLGVKSGPRLVPAMGPGLGRLRQHVCRAAGHGADVPGLITLLFRLRDRLLAWQKGLVQW